jgi:glutamate dehydrogenase/leucine dehydrogenase
MKSSADLQARPAPTADVIRYEDPVEGFRGYLAFSGNRHGLAAGGFRVQPGLRGETIVRLAQAMELKERLLGLAVDGAKAGIDYDPHAPGKQAAMRRFLEFVRPHLVERLSLGPDMGTAWPELESVAHQIGLVSVKGAIARAQGLDQADFLARIRLLDVEVDGATLGARRAGHALAHAALGAIEAADLDRGAVRVGIQGFGTLGRATAMALTEAGVTPTAVTDEHTCLHCYEDLARHASPEEVPAEVGPPQQLFELPLDVLVLAACEDALSIEEAPRLQASAVVVGANLALSRPVERLLHRRGVLVVPDFVGGCGGSASMDALFGPAACPTVTEVLEALGTRMRTLVAGVLSTARARRVTPREAALTMAGRDVPPGRPYGRCEP